MASKILVVDDDSDIRNLLSDFLAKQGYEVILARNGHEAIDIAANDNPQMILLDVRMPGLDGIATCTRLKAERQTRSIPVIMATGFTDRLTAALQAGADDLVTKPFHLLDLLIRVKSMLRIQHLPDEQRRAVAYTLELQKNFPKI